MCGMMSGKAKTEELPGPERVSPYSTASGQGLANDITSGTKSLLPTLQARGATAATSYERGATNPGWEQATNLANNTIRGDYLGGSPQFQAGLDAIRRGGTRTAADQAASARSRASLAGAPMGTAGLQAIQAGNAATSANTEDTIAKTLAENYARERGYQMAAPGMLKEAVAAPGQLYEAGNAAQLNPLATSAQILQTADRAPMYIPKDFQRVPGQKGILSYIGQGAMAAAPMAGPYAPAVAAGGGIMSQL